VAEDEATAVKDEDVVEAEEDEQESAEVPDGLEDVDLDTDIDIGDIDIPDVEDDTAEAEA
jgi:hypothetical protein